MKDALGHGSNTRGGKQTPVQAENAPFKSRLGKKAGHSYLDPNDPRANMKPAEADKWKFSKDAASGQMTGSRSVGTHAAGTTSTPQLQRRHFEAIAAELKSAPDAGSPAHAKRVSEMADKLATTNPGFRRDFFVKAATGGDYRFKGPGKNAGEVAKKAARFNGGHFAGGLGKFKP